jgi:hypothetical protein
MTKTAEIKIKVNDILKDIKKFLRWIEKNHFRSVNDIEIVERIDFYCDVLDQIIKFNRRMAKKLENNNE